MSGEGMWVDKYGKDSKDRQITRRPYPLAFYKLTV